MRGKLRLYIDQYGNCFYARTVRELCAKVGYSKASRMYADKKDGQTVHIGYVVGAHWLTAYQPVEKEI